SQADRLRQATRHHGPAASRPAASIGRSGTKSITPSWCMAAAPSASSTTWRRGYGPPWTPPTVRTPDGKRDLSDCRCPPPAHPEPVLDSDHRQARQARLTPHRAGTGVVCHAPVLQRSNPMPASTCMIAMRDGIRLATDLHLPDGAGPYPVIIER